MGNSNTKYMSFYRNQLESWLKTINVNAEKVLDLGGASNPVRNRVNSWRVNDCIFFDNGAEQAKVEYMPFDINIQLEDQLKGYKEKDLQFDALFCLEVFEYVWNPVEAMRNIYRLMGQDSVAYISFPAIYPVHQPYEIDSLRYTKAVIERYLHMWDFQQIEIIPRIATLGKSDLSRFYTTEGMHPLRGSQLPFDIGYLVKARKLTLV